MKVKQKNKGAKMLEIFKQQEALVKGKNIGMQVAGLFLTLEDMSQDDSPEPIEAGQYYKAVANGIKESLDDAKIEARSKSTLELIEVFETYVDKNLIESKLNHA